MYIYTYIKCTCIYTSNEQKYIHELIRNATLELGVVKTFESTTNMSPGVTNSDMSHELI